MLWMLEHPGAIADLERHIYIYIFFFIFLYVYIHIYIYIYIFFFFYKEPLTKLVGRKQMGKAVAS